ncbi:MAG TPA: ABC transporter permease [Solirubrobacteraceae bacterium]|jgi:ABC-2 type transport system permease protein|nr:ABC transporter permease [Solirubrobacteraceae bacterium]
MYFLIKRLLRMWRERQSQKDAAAPPTAPPAAAAPSNSSPPAAPRVDGPSASSRGPLALLLHEALYDIKISARNPRARFFGFFFPIVLLVVFIGVFGNSHTTFDGARVSLKVFYVPGILTMSIVTNAYASLVILVSGLREQGVLKRRRATPVPAVVLIGGQALATVVTTALAGAILLLIAKLAYGVGMAGPAIVAVACTALVGTVAFACIGYAVSGMIGSQEAAQPVVQMTMLPLWFISGVFIPISNLSRGLKDLADVFPVQHLANSLHLASVQSSFGASISATDVLVLAIWAAGAAALAGWRFSWLPAGAAA